MSSKKAELTEIGRNFTRLADTIQDNENRFHFLVGIVYLAENHLDDLHKSIFVKDLAHYIATNFSRYKNIQSTREMLQIWKFVGKYSKSLGMEGVLKQLDELGYFKQIPEFYIMWCEFHGESGKEDEFNQVIKKCKQNGAWNNFAQQEVNRLRTRFFSFDDDRTDLLFQNLQRNDDDLKLTDTRNNLDNVFHDKENDTPIAVNLANNGKKNIVNKIVEKPALMEVHNNHRISELPASELSRVSEESEEIESSSNSKNSDPSTKMASVESAVKLTNLSRPEALLQPQRINFDPVGSARKPNTLSMHENSGRKTTETTGTRDFAAAGISFSTNLYRNVVDAFANTLPLSQEVIPLVVEETQNTETTVDFPRIQPLVSTTPAFEIFCDEDDHLADKFKPQEKPTLKLRHVEEQKVLSDSPLAKKSKSDVELAPKSSVSFGEEEIANNFAVGSYKRVQIPELGAAPDDIFKKPPTLKPFVAQQSHPANSHQTHSSPTATIQLRDDDVTVAGTHKSNQPMFMERATSTPQRAAAPPLNDDLTRNFALENKKQLDFDMETDENFFMTSTNEKVKFFDKAEEDEPISEFQRRLSITNNPSKTFEAKQSDTQVSKASEGSAKKFGATYDLAQGLGRLSLVGKLSESDVDFNETTGTGLVKEEIVGDLNPWDERKHTEILRKFLPPTVERHDFLTEKCPRFEIKGSINLGGERLDVKEIIGRGGFATVYKCISENNRLVAIKHQVPPCPWEFYICKTLQYRLPQHMLEFVMSIQDIYIFSNASAIVYDFYRHGTLLDLSNNYKRESAEINGAVLGVIGIQMAKTLRYVHESTIIHGDIKPDNFIVFKPMNIEVPSTIGEWDRFLNVPIIKLIDWGRAIDMRHFQGKTFRGRAGTECFDCVEMTKNLPWTYQTDYYGFVCTIYVLMFQEYMKTQFSQGKYRPLKNIKRRLVLRQAWETIFDEFLNIPNCHSQPSWTKAISELEKQLKQAVVVDVSAWKKAIERYNSLLPIN